MRIKTKAILLNSLPTRESDLILSFFTQKLGKARLLAKGALRSKKRFLGILLHLNELKIELELSKSPEFPFRLSQADLLSSHWELAGEPLRFASAYALAELCERASPELEPDKELYLLLASGLEQIQKEKNSPALLFYYLLKIFSHLGYLPGLKFCVICEAPLSAQNDKYLFSIKRGGLVCSKCAQKEKALKEFSSPLIPSLRAMSRLKPQQAKKIVLKKQDLISGLELFSRFSSWHLEKPILSLEVLRNLLKEKS